MVNVKGAFRLTKIKWTGSNIQYAAIFLEDSVVFVKIGGQFADPNFGVSLGLVLGGPIGAFAGYKVQKSGRDKKLDALKKFSVDDILKADKNNFQLFYKDISKVEIKKSKGGINGARAGKISFNKNSFDIQFDQKYEECEKIIKSVLGKKIV